MIGTPNETTPVDGKESLEETRPVSEEKYPLSVRATAVWWLAALLQQMVDSKIDEPTLRITVIPAARHILEGLQ